MSRWRFSATYGIPAEGCKFLVEGLHIFGSSADFPKKVTMETVRRGFKERLQRSSIVRLPLHCAQPFGLGGVDSPWAGLSIALNIFMEGAVVPAIWDR
jgi:hypothetical protein